MADPIVTVDTYQTAQAIYDTPEYRSVAPEGPGFRVHAFAPLSFDVYQPGTDRLRAAGLLGDNFALAFNGYVFEITPDNSYLVVPSAADLAAWAANANAPPVDIVGDLTNAVIAPVQAANDLAGVIEPIVIAGTAIGIGLGIPGLGQLASNVVSAIGDALKTVWGVLRAIYTNILQPAFNFVDQKILGLIGWVRRTFAPVFEFLAGVRHFLTDIYDRFVRPVLDFIDFVHKLDLLLQTFHIDLLKGLDNVLQGIERRIDDAIFWLYGKLNDVINILAIIVTADGFFQRYIFLRTQARDVGYSWRILINAGGSHATDLDRYRPTRAFATAPITQVIDDTTAWLNGNAPGGDEVLDAAVAAFADFVQQDQSMSV